jgi:hypothetical protein
MRLLTLISVLVFTITALVLTGSSRFTAAV